MHNFFLAVESTTTLLVFNYKWKDYCWPTVEQILLPKRGTANREILD